MDRKIAKFKFLQFLSGFGFGVTFLSMMLLFQDQPLGTEASAVAMGAGLVLGLVGYFLGREKQQEL